MGLNTAIATRVNGTPPPEVPIADIELGSLDFWALDDDVRDGAFATLRREAPISFWPTIELPGFVAGNGHWALTKYDDVFYASRHPDIFSSYPNITINDQTPELAEYFGSMIVLDDPRHQRLRSIVSRAFTPKVVARIEAAVRDRAHRLVSSMIANNPDRQADLVSELAGPLPLQIICDMMGIPKADHQRIFHWTNVILGFGDPDLATDFDEFMQVSADIGAYATTAVEEIVRWASPVVYMRRTLTQDIELRGTKMAAGDKVSLWYCSANRDESKFADPWTFDLARNPNPHLGFGGGGAHFCLGANLARREIRVAFDELRRQMPDVVATEEPARLLSQFIHGIKTLPVTWS